MKKSLDNTIGASSNQQEAASVPVSKSSSLRITDIVCNIDTGESFYKVRYIDCDGKVVRKLIGREQFLKPAHVVNILVKAHWACPDGQDKCVQIVNDAVRRRRKQRYRVTKRTGWYEGTTFVYPTQTFGQLGGQLRYEAGSNEIDPALGLRRGNIQGWREGLREPCRYSDYLVLTVSTPFAGTLLDVVGEEEGATMHLHGTDRQARRRDELKTKSTSGKTLATRAAASTMGSCRKNDLITFAITERAVEDYCFARNSLAATFDEEGRSLSSGHGPKMKSTQLAYMIPSGRGAVRSSKATRDQDLQNLSWAEFAISTGENPLDSNAVQRSEGVQVRMISVPVPPGRKGGIFNKVEGPGRAQKARRLAEKTEEIISAHSGIAMPAYLRKLVPQRGSKLARRIRRIIEKFVRRVGADVEPWERRFATKFGLILAGAILVAEFGVAPWTDKRAWRAITRIYRKARAAIVSVQDATDDLTRRLRKLVTAGKRFPEIKKGKTLGAERARKAWGVVKVLPNGRRVVLIKLERLRDLVRPAAIVGQVLTELCNRGIALKSGGKLTRQVMIQGFTGDKRRRYVCLDYSKLSAQP